MRRIWSVTVARDAGQNATWQRVGKIMQSCKNDVTVTPIGEIMWLADTESGAMADALAEDLARVGAQALRSARTVFDDEDYAAADFIGVTGVDLSLDPPFVPNAAEAYHAEPPCPQCGHHDALDVTVSEPPRISEALLDRPAPDGSQPGPHGWEAVNLPNGGLLLSTRLFAELRDSRVVGLASEEVLDPSGAPSARMTALRAPVAVLTPCPRHSRIEGADLCPGCGTAHSSLDGYFWMPRSIVGNAEIVSRHPQRAAMLYVSPRVYTILVEVPGIRRGDPVRVCDD